MCVLCQNYIPHFRSWLGEIRNSIKVRDEENQKAKEEYIRRSREKALSIESEYNENLKKEKVNSAQKAEESRKLLSENVDDQDFWVSL